MFTEYVVTVVVVPRTPSVSVDFSPAVRVGSATYRVLKSRYVTSVVGLVPSVTTVGEPSATVTVSFGAAVLVSGE